LGALRVIHYFNIAGGGKSVSQISGEPDARDVEDTLVSANLILPTNRRDSMLE
jgi:hypothetical protein